MTNRAIRGNLGRGRAEAPRPHARASSHVTDSIRTGQEVLCHRDVKTTMIDTHVLGSVRRETEAALDALEEERMPAEDAWASWHDA